MSDETYGVQIAIDFPGGHSFSTRVEHGDYNQARHMLAYAIEEIDRAHADDAPEPPDDAEMETHPPRCTCGSTDGVHELNCQLVAGHTS